MTTEKFAIVNKYRNNTQQFDNKKLNARLHVRLSFQRTMDIYLTARKL